MRTRTLHNDSTASEATRYGAILTTLPLPPVVGAAVGAPSLLPISPVVGASGPISIAVLAYGLFVATPKSAAGPTSDPGALAETDTPFDGITTRVRDDTGRNHRRGGA